MSSRPVTSAAPAAASNPKSWDSSYTTINAPGIGKIKYKKIGDLTADELTGAVVDARIKYVDPDTNELLLISHYDLFKDGTNTVAPFSEDKRARNGVELYKVVYPISNKGRIDKVTGLLSVPTGLEAKGLPLLSWQHGTDFIPTEAPSEIMKKDQLQARPPGSVLEGQIRSTETLFNLARLGGNGYIVAAADYNGLGGSKTPQYYGVDEPTTKATSGMLKASSAILKKLELKATNLFMNGWSQGALNTLFLQRNLEDEGNPIVKAAHASTFSSLTESANYWFTDVGYPNWATTCIPLILGSYQAYYDIKGLMKKAIKPEYLKISKDIFQGKVNWDNVTPPDPDNKDEGFLGLPAIGGDMLKPRFLKEIREKRGEFYERLKQNDPLKQTFTHPSRFYGGGQDTAIPPGYSVDVPVDFLAPLATGVSIDEQATHRSTFLGSLYGSFLNPQDDIFTWFAE
jgi:hypothetical protein